MRGKIFSQKNDNALTLPEEKDVDEKNLEDTL